ncbi:tetratricopeptide repeat protein [Campylobacter concisus]
MKKVLNFGLIVAASFMLSGCWSWQKMVSFGFWQSDEEARAERLELEKEKMVQNCESGNSIDCNNLAVNFSNEKDFVKAKGYYEKACNAGLATACSNLGQIYEQGLVDEQKDIEKALKLYKLACDSGDGVGCYNEAMGLKSYIESENLKTHKIDRTKAEARVLSFWQRAASLSMLSRAFCLQS